MESTVLTTEQTPPLFCVSGEKERGRVGCLLSVFALAQLGFVPPIVITAVYAFLAIRFEDTSILDFIRYAVAFFFGRQQTYEWRTGV